MIDEQIQSFREMAVSRWGLEKDAEGEYPVTVNGTFWDSGKCQLRAFHSVTPMHEEYDSVKLELEEFSDGRLVEFISLYSNGKAEVLHETEVKS